jgi:hypothetical protein
MSLSLCLGTTRLGRSWLACALFSLVACSSDAAAPATRPQPMRVTPGAGGAGAEAPSPRAGSSGFGQQPSRIPLQPSAAGQAGEVAPADCGTYTHSAEVKLGPVDIVWIIDGSGSMLDELAAVQQNITNFANMIGQAGIDHRVVMLAPGDVAMTTPLGMDPSHYLFVLAPVDSHNALQLLLDLHPQYRPFLRPEAALHFVVVSDDESFLAADAFQTQMEALAGKSFTFHAIASEDVNGLPCVGACGLPVICGGSAPGRQYYALADATGGERISICIADWSMVFGPLQSAVIASAPLPCDYPLPVPPAGSNLDPNKLNFEYAAPASERATFPRADGLSACADKAAWFYDDPGAPTRIQMCPAACELIGAGGTIEIELGCETVRLD